jgi:hypothetical protein
MRAAQRALHSAAGSLVRALMTMSAPTRLASASLASSMSTAIT